MLNNYPEPQSPPSGSTHGKALGIDDFREVGRGCFNASIRTSQAMIWFGDALIVGTGRRPLGFLGRYTARNKFATDREGSEIGFVGRVEEQGKDGAQVWRFDPYKLDWSLVYESPLGVGRDGKERARDRSIRASTVFQGPSDDHPCLYLGVGSLERQVVILRSPDGINYAECTEKGLGLSGDADVPSLRCLCSHGGRVYTSPTGKNRDRGMLDDNLTDFPMIFATNDPWHGHWEMVSEPGFGDPTNLSVNEIASFNGFLYAATLNPQRGFQVWKTDARGASPYRWKKIIDCGAWRGPASSVPASLFAYRNALYLGSGIQRQGRDGHDRYGPFPGELIRIHPDDSWDLVVGDTRPTPHGLKRPISGLAAGFGDLFTHAFWRMSEYDGYLYLGTSDWRFLPTYLRNRDELSPACLAYLKSETEKYIKGSFSLWCSADGIRWHPVTRTGFGGNPNNYGIRELTSSPVGLFVAPTATQPRTGGGGLEIWWGNKKNVKII